MNIYYYSTDESRKKNNKPLGEQFNWSALVIYYKKNVDQRPGSSTMEILFYIGRFVS